MTIGEALKSLRLKAGLTQKQMAADIVTESFYSKIERGIHKIDADTLIAILAEHHFDVIEFFSQIVHQTTERNPNFEVASEIVFAQNQKDLKKLDKISYQMKNGEIKADDWLKMRLEWAYAWVHHSNKFVSPSLKAKVKNILTKGEWDRTSYHYLSQAVILLDIDDAYQLVDSAFTAYEKKPKTDTFTLQFLGFVGVNFLNCCYHQHANIKYADRAIQFLRSLPVEPAIGLAKLIGEYYDGLFNGDESKKECMLQAIKYGGYLSIIEDTLDRSEN